MAGTTITSPAAPIPSKSTGTPLQVVRAMDFDWTLHLQRVWTDPPFDSAELHTDLRQRFAERLDELLVQPTHNSPLGWVVVGPAGSGKTHWLSVCRQQAVARKMGFVLVDLTDVKDFWQTVLQGYLDSLQQIYQGQKFQQQILIERFLATLPLKNSVDTTLAFLRAVEPDILAKNVSAVMAEIHRRYPQQCTKFGDVIRALLATSSGDAEIAAAGLSWLSGNPVDDSVRTKLRFTTSQETPKKIVQALSWLMSLCGPTVVAFDQLDPIVSYLNLARQPGNSEPTIEVNAAKAIIENLSAGFGAMRDVTFRTLTLIVGLEATWGVMAQQTLAANLDRYEPPQMLGALQRSAAAESIVWPRVAAAADRFGFKPPFPTWPFKRDAFEQLEGLSPRQLLKRCELHRKACLAAGQVNELASFNRPEEQIVQKTSHAGLDAAFLKYCGQANPAELLEEATEDERLEPVLLGAFRAFVREITLPDTSDPLVDQFPGGKTTKPLHARLRIVNHAANDHEEHFCARALQRTNATSFQTRIKAVLTGSGIDSKLPFRRVVIIRTTKLPGGNITGDLLKKYEGERGMWHAPKEDEVRKLAALARLISESPDGLDDWLKSRKPVSALPLFQMLAPQLCAPQSTGNDGTTGGAGVEHKTGGNGSGGQGTGTGAGQATGVKGVTTTGTKQVTTTGATQATTTGAKQGTTTGATQATTTGTKNAKTELTLGQRVGAIAGPVALPLALLEKHTVVLAGAGSGKTVLLKRIIEEAAVCGIPSIVIDCANDMAALGQRWPEGSAELASIDADAAAKFHSGTEVVIWTPGREDGNPLVFEPVPDLGAVADDAIELQGAIDMVRESLAGIVAPGRSETATSKIGILSSALRFLAKSAEAECSLKALIEVLTDLPAEAGTGVERQARLARAMADALRTQLEVNPLLRGSGTNFDPAVLFGDDTSKRTGTRISIVSLTGLGTMEMQQHFLNQLSMTLFAWIKRNPTPPGRPLRGLLVIDEAKDFVPSQRSTVCKASLQRLAAQARKYHLGVVFATQNPREIENTIIGNCSTQFYGKASSPAAQDVIRDQLAQRNGSGTDIGSLPKGTFYFCNADSAWARPVKIQVPLCLSHHVTMEPTSVIEQAAKCRETLRRSI